MKVMSRARRIRSAAWRLRVLSVMTLVALVVAPSCAPLCASRNCPRADGSATANGSCHESGAMSHEALRARALRNCGSPELPAVVSGSVGLRGDSSVSRVSMSGGELLLAEQQNAGPSMRCPDHYFGRSPDILSSFVSAPPSVLRI